MATIRKRGKSSYAVVYYYKTDLGERKQRWETYKTYADALKRLEEIDGKGKVDSNPSSKQHTVESTLEEYVRLYGEKVWTYSTFVTNSALISNYILPLIGHKEMKDITPKEVDRLITALQKTAPVEAGGRKRKTEYLPAISIEKIIKLLRSAFKQAVRWEIIPRNPFDSAQLPKVERKSREIWTADTIRTALDHCKDDRLYIAINLAFACSLRLGEILGLTWDNVHIEDSDIDRDDASVYIDKELFRASKEVMEILNNRDIIYVFPPAMSYAKSRLVLKTPKTKTSVRRVWLPRTLAYMLRDWRRTQERKKEFLGNDYNDFNLVVTQDNGRPCEVKLIEKAFKRLKEEAGLPDVVFHSLRHSSATYKLKLNHGDIKATQGDTGHAQADMVTRVYAHILDEDRKLNAKRFETAFYAQPNEGQNPGMDIEKIAEQLRRSPELMRLLIDLLQTKSSENACQNISNAHL